MRILTVHPGPQFSVADVHDGWVKAFRQLGVDTASFNLHDRLTFYENASAVRNGKAEKMLSSDAAIVLAAKGIEAACYEFWPDVLFVVSAGFVPLKIMDLVRARGTKVVILHTESPYEDGKQLKRAEHADLNLVNDPTHLDRFQQIGPAYYAGHCYDPDIHHPAPPAHPDHVSQFCMVASGYPSRIEFLEQVNWDGIDAALAGNWKSLDAHSPLTKFVCHDLEACIDNTDAADLYRGTQASANLYRKEADQPELVAGWAMGPREVELAACGTFYLTEARGENRDVFPMIPTFEDPEDFEQQLRWYLAHDDARAEIARAARAAGADRTFTASARCLLRAVNNL